MRVKDENFLIWLCDKVNIFKFKFGPYAVVSSKMGWTTRSQRSNFWNTKTESKSTEKFSFVLASEQGDSANVNAANNIETQTFSEFGIYFAFRIENEWLLKETKNFSAYITVNRDTTDVWSLIMTATRGARTDKSYEAVLSNGIRTIYIDPITSNRKGEDKRNFPALGYELVEDDKALCALQYFGGGAFGLNKNIVWLRNDLDQKMKIMLAAAMTAILEIRVEETSM